MSGQKTKAELVAELNRYLFVEVDWERMSIEDLQKLYAAFERLRVEIEQIFALLDEITEISMVPGGDGKREWENYVI